jgi:hypothetical protein
LITSARIPGTVTRPLRRTILDDQDVLETPAPDAVVGVIANGDLWQSCDYDRMSPGGQIEVDIHPVDSATSPHHCPHDSSLPASQVYIAATRLRLQHLEQERGDDAVVRRVSLQFG